MEEPGYPLVFIFDWGISHISLLEVSGRKISSPKRSEPAGLETQSLVRPPGMAAALGCCRGLIAAVILSRLNMSRYFLLLIFLELQFSLSLQMHYVCISWKKLPLIPYYCSHPSRDGERPSPGRGRQLRCLFKESLFTATSAFAFRYS